MKNQDNYGMEVYKFFEFDIINMKENNRSKITIVIDSYGKI